MSEPGDGHLVTPGEASALADRQALVAAIDPATTQRQAAFPGASAWVAASAGTGKTKVLTDRVLSLMLAGTAPARIVCLTFTKAAAAEMRDRIASRLSDWAVMSDPDLDEELTLLTGRPSDEEQRGRARQLFARVLDTPGGLNIQTIHSFCQSLLSRFPLEAGVPPHFTVLEERDGQELLVEATHTVLAAAERAHDPLAQALAEVTRYLDPRGFREILRAIVNQRHRFAHLIGEAGTVEAASLDVFALLEIAGDVTDRDLVAQACADDAFDAEGLRQAAAVLDEKGKGSLGADIARWLQASAAERQREFGDYTRLFLTDLDKAEPRIKARLVAQAITRRHPFVAEVVAEEAERLLTVERTRRRAATAQATSALLRLTDGILREYQRLKDRRAALDYHDLILRAGGLLEQAGGTSWVMYKLDASLDHVLIDEAQDTSPAQWRIVRALTREFFTDESTRGRRSVFAVGDVKQSIYSFQDADPREFLRNRDRFAEQVTAGGGEWRTLTLDTSFRSTAAVLAVVDAVFANADARRGVALDGLGIGHRVSAKRRGEGGLVEVWPTLGPRADDRGPDWKPSIERRKQDSAELRLAALIARRIHGMISERDLLQAKNRPVTPGDFLVLVQRRRAFAVELVRVLKEYGIAVAGVDRLVLSEHIAVMDLVALGRFVLLPSDDLTLATLLKSPLIGFDDEDLFAIAHNRDGTLWSALRRRAAQNPRYPAAVSLLTELLALADLRPPFDFYTHALAALGGRRHLLARLGPEAEEPIAEFLDLALDYERIHPPSLQGFLRWFEAGTVEIKRDLEQRDVDAVRIMTVHGAKGLQAPIVILPDTVRMPERAPVLSWHGTEPARLLWPPSTAHRDRVANEETERWRRAQEEEYRRLLYVAMTRAEDRLIVCGWRTKRQTDGEPDGCWYRLIREGLSRHAEDLGLEQARDPFLARAPEFDGEPIVWRVQSPQLAAPAAPTPRPPLDPVPLPTWAREPPPAEPAPLSPLIPSRPTEDEPPVRPPIAGGGTERFKRGRLMHRLLQSLPAIPPGRRAEVAQRWLARPIHDLSEEARAEIVQEVLRVLDEPAFAALFAPGSLAEAPITGVVNGRVVFGQIDRLVIDAETVHVLDYKTDRPPPRQPEGVAPIYLKQMAAYRAVLSALYPERRVICSLLWTDGPSLMTLPEALLDPHAP